LFAADPRSAYWLEGFSPSGRYLLFYTAKAGKVALGAYDFVLHKVKSFDVAPAVQIMGGHRSAWISQDEFVFSALPEGDQPANISLRRYTGERLSQEWQKAWRGVEPTGSEVDSHVQDEEDAFLQGRLFRANARTGALTQMADGLYETLVRWSLLPDDPASTGVDCRSAADPLHLQLVGHRERARSCLE
jgi:hypothetical protein